MSGNSVVGLAASRALAESVVDRLCAAGFSHDDISVLLPDQAGTREFAHEQHTRAPEGITAGVTAGGAVGGTLGLLAGIGLLAIPGLGPLLAAGPLVAALGGAAAGGALGGVAGGLIGLGIPEHDAHHYESKVRAGGVLISVHVEDFDGAGRAEEILEAAGIEDISRTSKAPVPPAA